MTKKSESYINGVIPSSDAEKNRFYECSNTVITGGCTRRGIGTLGERTLHAILKNYFEPDTQYHEQKLGRYVADIFKNGEVTEIQTRSFSALRQKLKYYTAEHRVNVIFPIAAIKHITWIDPESGELSERRKSPNRGMPWDILRELYALRPIMPLDGVRFTLVFCNMDEFRLLTGRSRDKKHFGASRYERIPTELIGTLTLESPADYKFLIPESLSKSFTAADFAKVAKMTRRNAGYALRTLVTIGAIEHTDTQKNTYIYTIRDCT